MKIKNSSLLQKLKTKKGIQAALIAVGCFIFILIFVLSSSGSKKKVNSQQTTADLYVAELEGKLSDTLGKIEGAGKVRVMITVASGMLSVPATESTTSGAGSTAVTVTKPVISNGKPVIVGENYPEITGVIIVSEGANQIKVKLELSLAAATVLNINQNKIQVFAGS